MNRGEIITRFREENPEITPNLAADSVLQSWCQVGNLETSMKARLIKQETTWSAVVGTSEYNLLNQIDRFYDVDELPGGGVVYDGKRIKFESVASLDYKRPSWRSASNGTPIDYYRRNQFLTLGCGPDATDDILVYSVLKADDLDDDSKSPFNQLAHLEPFHYVMVLYLKMRAFMGKVKKPEIAQLAQAEYDAYVKWIKSEVDRGIYRQIQMRPPVGARGTGRTRR